MRCITFDWYAKKFILGPNCSRAIQFKCFICLFHSKKILCTVEFHCLLFRKGDEIPIELFIRLFFRTIFAFQCESQQQKKTIQDVNFAITSENGNQLTVISTNWLHRLHISSYYVICNWILSAKKKSSTRHNDNDLERFGLLFSREAAKFAHKSSRSQHKASMCKIKKKIIACDNDEYWMCPIINVEGSCLNYITVIYFTSLSSKSKQSNYILTLTHNTSILFFFCVKQTTETR